MTLDDMLAIIAGYSPIQKEDVVVISPEGDVLNIEKIIFGPATRVLEIHTSLVDYEEEEDN